MKNRPIEEFIIAEQEWMAECESSILKLIYVYSTIVYFIIVLK